MIKSNPFHHPSIQSSAIIFHIIVNLEPHYQYHPHQLFIISPNISLTNNQDHCPRRHYCNWQQCSMGVTGVDFSKAFPEQFSRGLCFNREVILLFFCIASSQAKVALLMKVVLVSVVVTVMMREECHK